ncbi:3-oxoacyl-[acyl-carrier protein] reductase [Salsuginibacillus halophilus]|uniref:3-oxoacyl-[acyl-carrier protein] reductase n=1 Tax=Salsuginibacillus halophilus TaxID=517424 RepID=A0A2P8HWI5_9BACI|nr:SDR family oxidoreductase [Salsuginibacillus halophilus]PSL50591.1 3-oxoacyl-[acyl-carrier protein] reductase [Salsuginibacillus halophilus]
MEKVLQGKAAIVTGSARGIGFACARSLASKGANITLVDVLDAEPAKENLLNEFPSVQVITQQVDVKNNKEIESAVKHTVHSFGSVDIVVNNAGTCSRQSLEKMSEDEWLQDIDTNLRGTFLFMKSAIYPYMREQQSGKIINISSISGMMGGAISYNENGDRTARSGPAYAASKGGIIALTKWVAKEVGEHGINVNSVAPGPVQTEITKGMSYPLDLQSIKRPGEPEDIGEAVAYLATPAADYVTGEVLKVCGGSGIS